jgi:tRNA(Ser,Leu) C12 N-acetylase TAN1
MPTNGSGTRSATGGPGGKRKYRAKNHSNDNQRNPKRGGPGVLLTCETGREKKCRQEAIDILNHYYRMEVRTNKNSNNNKQGDGDNGDDDDDDATHGEDGNDDNTPLSLDEEIKQLQTKKKEKQIFSVYETGVRGTISLLCTLPEAILVAPFTFNKETYQPPKPSNDNNDTTLDHPEPASKKPKVGGDESNEVKVAGTESVSTPTTLVVPTSQPEASSSTHHASQFHGWDPVRTVQRILNDLRQGSSNAPSSRFVTRMIPIQVSCFTNDAEMSHCARELFARIMTTATTTTTPDQEAHNKQDDVITFAIQVKRRICSHLKSKNVIELIAKEAPMTWKVNLSHPRFTVVVEICKTLCGMSIVEHLQEYGNFNLLETREQGTAAARTATKHENPP